MSRMRIVFAGTPDFSVPVLQALLDADCDVVGVYCQPDRPAGRGRKLQPGPVKQLALRSHIPVYQPLSLKSEEEQQALADLHSDLMVVVAYGLILPQIILDTPRVGCVNLHASLLPRWRGAAPIQRAIIAGDSRTGVCLMQMEAGLDTGPVLDSASCEINITETGGALHDRLSEMSAALLVENLENLSLQLLAPRQQDDALATYARKLEKQEAQIDWSTSALYIDRQVRGFNPWPVAYSSWQERPLRIWQSEVIETDSHEVPGSVVKESKQGIDIACGQGQLRLIQIQLPGGKRIPVADFLNGRSLKGAVLGQ
ncbi:MAG: methionyl-tRNA formyltransferase [Gammaproteobacteria bacterium]